MADFDLGEKWAEMDLEFKGTAEERRKQAEVVIMRMHRDLYGNGTPGLLPRIETFMTRHDARESEREKVQKERHEENTFRLDRLTERAGKKTLSVTIASLAVTIAGVVIAALGIFVMVKLANHSAVDIHRMFSNAPTVLATDSAIPSVR